jgi:hypothetical protein
MAWQRMAHEPSHAGSLLLHEETYKGGPAGSQGPHWVPGAVNGLRKMDPLCIALTKLGAGWPSERHS